MVSSIRSITISRSLSRLAASPASRLGRSSSIFSVGRTHLSTSGSPLPFSFTSPRFFVATYSSNASPSSPVSDIHSSNGPKSQSQCPKCQTPLQLIVPRCPSCSNPLAPPHPDSQNLFQLFELPLTPSGQGPRYKLPEEDQKKLKFRWRKLQSEVHPDKVASMVSAVAGGSGNQSIIEAWSKGWSSWVNDGYRILDSDLKRAEYLLSLYGVTIEEADSLTDPELLMSVMEIREALEEADGEITVARIRKENQKNIHSTVEEISSAFDEKNPPELERAKGLIIQLRYWDNVENVCREWQPGKRIELQH